MRGRTLYKQGNDPSVGAEQGPGEPAVTSSVYLTIRSSLLVYASAGVLRGSLSRDLQAPPSGGPRALGAPPGSLEGVMQAAPEASWKRVSQGLSAEPRGLLSVDCHAGGTRKLGRAPDGNPQAVRDAGLGGKVRTSWSQRTVHDAVLLMQGLGCLCRVKSHLMLGGGGRVPQAQSFPAPHHSSVLS